MKNSAVYEKIINYKRIKYKNSEIAEKLNISTSLVEKSLQLYRIRDNLKNVLSEDNYKKLESLNFKAFYIKPFISNVEYLDSLLRSIPYGATLDVLKNQINRLKGNLLINDSEYKKDHILTINKEIKIETDMLEELSLRREYIKSMTNSVFDEIMPNKGANRILENQIRSIAYVIDLDIWIFIGLVSKIDYIKLYSKGYIKSIPDELSSKYNAKYVIVDILKYIEYIDKSHIQIKEKLNIDKSDELITLQSHIQSKRQLLEIDEKISACNNRLTNKSSIDSSTEPIIKKEIKNMRLYLKCMNIFLEKGYVVDMNFNLKGTIVDIIGVNIETNSIIIVLYILTLKEYKENLMKYSYMLQCNELYILTSSEEVLLEVSKEKEIGCIYYSNEEEYHIKRSDKYRHSCMSSAKEIFRDINHRLLEKAYVTC